MIALYCQAHHGGPQLCPACLDLARYTRLRLESCPFQEDKPTCASCSVHCYSARHRDEVRVVMRWAGPRMLLHHPVLALLHMLDGRRRRRLTPPK